MGHTLGLAVSLVTSWSEDTEFPLPTPSPFIQPLAWVKGWWWWEMLGNRFISVWVTAWGLSEAIKGATQGRKQSCVNSPVCLPKSSATPGHLLLSYLPACSAWPLWVLSGVWGYGGWCLRLRLLLWFSAQAKSKWDEHIFTKGCIQALEGWLPRNIYIVAGVFIAISLLQVRPTCLLPSWNSIFYLGQADMWVTDPRPLSAQQACMGGVKEGGEA